MYSDTKKTDMWTSLFSMAKETSTQKGNSVHGYPDASTCMPLNERTTAATEAAILTERCALSSKKRIFALGKYSIDTQ